MENTDNRKLYGIPLDEIDWTVWDVVFAPNKEFLAGDAVGLLKGHREWQKHYIVKQCSATYYDKLYMIRNTDGYIGTYPSTYLLEWRAFK